jgi:hypothetical protein
MGNTTGLLTRLTLTKLQMLDQTRPRTGPPQPQTHPRPDPRPDTGIYTDLNDTCIPPFHHPKEGTATLQAGCHLRLRLASPACSSTCTRLPPQCVCQPLDQHGQRHALLHPILWTCHSFNISLPLHTSYVNDREVTLELIMQECGVTRDNAQENCITICTTPAQLPTTYPHAISSSASR